MIKPYILIRSSFSNAILPYLNLMTVKAMKNIYLIILLFAFFSCKKDKETQTSVEGRIMDKTSNAPISKAEVFLLREKRDCWTCGSGITDRVKSDGNGNYFMEFDWDNSYHYSVASSANMFFSNIESGGQSINMGKNNKVDIGLQPVTYIDFHIINVDTLNAFSQVDLNKYRGGVATFYGGGLDTHYIDLAPGNVSFIVHYILMNPINSTYQSITNPMYSPSFDTTEFSIYY